MPLGDKVAGSFDQPPALRSTISFDPVSKKALQILKEVGGIYELGLRFPFNNDSVTDLLVDGLSQTGTGVTTSDTTLNDARLIGLYPDDYWNGSTITCNGKTATVTDYSNASGQFLVGSWSGGGNPGNGNPYTVGQNITLSAHVNKYRDITVRTAATLNCTNSPTIICAREVIIDSGGVIDAGVAPARNSYAAGAGGAGIAGPAAGNPAGAPPETPPSDRGNETVTLPPQHELGWATGGSGGGGGGGGGSGANAGGAGGAGAKGGRACGQPDNVIVLAPPAGGAAGAAGVAGGAGGNGTAGTAGQTFDDVYTPGLLLSFFRTHVGGSFGGAGGAGGGGGANSGGNGGAGRTGAPRASGGGMLAIFCSRWTNNGTMKAIGTPGIPGQNGDAATGTNSGGGAASGGSGGGAGGLILVETVESMADGSFDVSGGAGAAGGTGGAKTGTGGVGGNGAAGGAGGAGIYLVSKGNSA